VSSLSEAPALVATLLVFACFATPGIAALARFAPELDSLERFAYGIPLGLTGTTLFLFGLACGVGLTPFAVIGTAVLALGVALGLRAPRVTAGERTPASSFLRTREGRIVALVLGAFALRFAILWWTVLRVDATGLSAGWVNLWADWGMHLGDVSSFAYGGNFPHVHPRLIGHAYSYHFLTSVTAAASVRLGLDPLVALPLHSFLLTIVLLFALYGFARHFVGGRGVAALAVTLVLLGGGLGWWLPIRAAFHAHGVLAALLAKPWSQPAEDAANFRWQNLYASLVGPQRSCLYGLPLGMLVLRLLDAATRSGERRTFLLAGVAAGLLPMAHQGTLLTLVLTVPALVLLFPSRGWLFFVAAAAAIGLPQEAFLARGNAGALSAVRFHLGWIAAPDPWPIFWLKNLGLLLPLAIAGFVWRTPLAPRARRFLLALMAPFVVANVFLLLPWDWDNTKVLTFWFIACCLAAAAAIAALWRSHGRLVRVALGIVVVSLTLSGALWNLSELLDRDRNLWLTPEELTLVQALRTSTPPHALIATGTRPNHPVTLLSGRRVVMGYPGWLWAQGLSSARAEQDLRVILAGGPAAESLIERDGVDDVVIGPEERGTFGARDSFFANRWPTIFTSADYRVFAVSRAR